MLPARDTRAAAGRAFCKRFFRRRSRAGRACTVGVLCSSTMWGMERSVKWGMAVAGEFGCDQPVLTRSWAPDIGTGSGLGGASAKFAAGGVPTPETALRRGRERVSNRRTLLRSPYFAVASEPWHIYAFRRRDPVQTVALQAQNSPFWGSLTPERLCAETGSHYSSSVLRKLRRQPLPSDLTPH